jgi:hemoglobin-like flavoprotein
MLTQEQVALVQQSYEKAAGFGADAVATLFYAELFAIDPNLRSMFSGDMTEQGRKLMATLTLVVRALKTPEKILEAVQELGVRHVKYGVEPEHYTLVGNALLRTLKKGLGDEFTPETRDAWIAAYRMLSQIMKEAAYGPAPLKTATSK